MAKYDAMGDRVRRRIPVGVWIMLLGVVVGVVGLIWCLNTDLKKYSKSENLYTDQNIEDVKNLDFEFDSADTVITRSSDRQIHVTIENAPEGIYSYGQKDNTFYIHRKKTISIIKWTGMSKIPFLKDIYPQAKITIELPSVVFDEVEIENGAGDLKISSIDCDKLKIDNGIGELDLLECTAEKAEIENGIGELDMNGCVFKHTELKNGIGAMTAKDCVFKGDTGIDSGIGEVTMTAKFKGDVDLELGIGEVTLNIDGDGSDYRITGDTDDIKIKGRSGSSGAEYKIKVDKGIGDITINFI